MARKPTTKAAEAVIEKGIPAAHQEHVEIASELAVITQGYSDERDLINQLLGQAQMADAFAKFSKTVFISKLAYVKENKIYQGLSGKATEDGLQCKGTWEEFCNLLGWVPQHANEAISNVRTFGEEALDSMSRMGIGYREMRQYRKLPDDERTALLEVAKTGDKDAFIDLAETLVVKHAKEKAELNSKVTELQAEYKALDRVAATSDTEKKQAKLALEKLQLRTAPWDERVAPFKKEITERQSIIDESVARHFQAVEALDIWVNTELANTPDYDPEAPTSMPVEVLTVLLHLSDAVDRTATLVANAQFELRNRFGGDIDAARQQLLDA